MSGLIADLVRWGVAAERLHRENFGSGPALTPGVAASPSRAPHRPARPAGAGPMVSFARSNLALPWDSTFQSLLELAEACDVPVRWACRTGVCHNCETGLIAGAVDYFVEPLTPPLPATGPWTPSKTTVYADDDVFAAHNKWDDSAELEPPVSVFLISNI